MSIGLLIITHNGIGNDILKTATDIFGALPTAVKVISIKTDSDYDSKLAQAEKSLQSLDSGDGVLVLSDIFGATPCNIALKAAHQHPMVKVVTGINLPMVIKALNYANLPLDKLANKALTAGQESIFERDK